MLRDTAYATVREEMDEDFEQCCEEIQESRKKRGMFWDTKALRLVSVFLTNNARNCSLLSVFHCKVVALQSMLRLTTM